MRTLRAFTRWLRHAFPHDVRVSSAWLRGRRRYHEENEL